MTNKQNVIKIELPNDLVPKFWYNIMADMPTPPSPHISSQTMKAATADELSGIFAKECIAQEYSRERYIEIPKEVRDIYRNYRMTPLYRARGLEKLLKTPARIYYKYEGSNATGSHKLNSAVPQAFYNHIEGIKRVTTETGAGQWGSALAMATSFFDMECLVYMVKCSYEQKPFRKVLMNTFGANVLASPSNMTEAGRSVLAKDPNCTGSLGIAISEALEDAVKRPDTHYALGSVLNHVCVHQSVIGQEAKMQLESIDEYPDIVIGCVGGGSNFCGIAAPFIKDKIDGKKLRAIAVEPTACPTLTKGVYAYDYGDSVKLGPITKMYTLGADFVPSSIHAGGLRYHGMSPIISNLYHDKLIEAQAYTQVEVLSAGMEFAKVECIVPAPESCHAIKSAMVEAEKCRETGEEKVILFNLSGHGYMDLFAYEKLLNHTLGDSTLEDVQPPKNLPKVSE